MQTYQTYEFKDLSREVKKTVYNKQLNDLIQFRLDIAGKTEHQAMINKYGEYYLEVTPWFYGSCFYELFRGSILLELKYELLNSFYTSTGNFIDFKE